VRGRWGQDEKGMHTDRRVRGNKLGSLVVVLRWGADGLRFVWDVNKPSPAGGR